MIRLCLQILNNCGRNLNGSNMHDMWIINLLHTKHSESEFEFPWWNICDRDAIEMPASVKRLVITK